MQVCHKTLFIPEGINFDLTFTHSMATTRSSRARCRVWFTYNTKWNSGIHETIIILMCYPCNMHEEEVPVVSSHLYYCILICFELYYYCYNQAKAAGCPIYAVNFASYSTCSNCHEKHQVWGYSNCTQVYINFNQCTGNITLLLEHSEGFCQSVTDKLPFEWSPAHPFCWGRAYRPMEVLQMTMWTWSLMTGAAVSGC